MLRYNSQYKMDEDLKKHIRKTGTTTIGIVCKDGIVLAADKRGTFGGDSGVSYIAGGDEEKIQKVNDRVVVTTAGVASDLQKVIKLTRAELKLKELKSKRIPSIKESANLFSTIVYQNIRQFSPIPGITHFLLAGYDEQEYALYNIFPDGYVQEIKDYSATGSGMVQCNPILDSDFKEGITLQEGMALAIKCIGASMKRDPATGAGMDIYIITKDSIKHELTQEIKTDYPDAKNLKKK
jgi:proteasome beta subunit